MNKNNSTKPKHYHFHFQPMKTTWVYAALLHLAVFFKSKLDQLLEKVAFLSPTNEVTNIYNELA